MTWHPLSYVLKSASHAEWAVGGCGWSGGGESVARAVSIFLGSLQICKLNATSQVL